MDENMAADVLTGTDASAEGADFDGLFDMDGGEATAEPQETEGQEGAAETQEPEADPAEGTCADAQPGRQEQQGHQSEKGNTGEKTHGSIPSRVLRSVFPLGVTGILGRKTSFFGTI